MRAGRAYLFERKLVLGRKGDPVLRVGTSSDFQASEVPDLPLPVLLEEVDGVVAPHPVGPHALAVYALTFRLAE